MFILSAFYNKELRTSSVFKNYLNEYNRLENMKQYKQILKYLQKNEKKYLNCAI